MSSTSWIDEFFERVAHIGQIRLDYIPIWISDLLADENVQAMSTEQKGAYLLLLMRGWQQRPPASIPDDDDLLCKWVGLSKPKWLKNRDLILKPFTRGADGRLYQKRLASEWDKAVSNYLSRKKGADKVNAQRRLSDPLSDPLSARSGQHQRTHPPSPPPSPHRTTPNRTEPPSAERAGGAALNGDGDELDHEIRQYVSGHEMLGYSPRTHSEVRKLVEARGWDFTRKWIDDGIEKGKSFPTSHALGVLNREERTSAGQSLHTKEDRRQAEIDKALEEAEHEITGS